MPVKKRYVFIFILLYVHFVVANVQETSPTLGRRKRHIFPLLGYLRGYKMGQHFALQYPPYFLPPIIVLPTINQQQAINIQKSYSEENYQESGGIFQNIKPAKLILNGTFQGYSVEFLKDSENPCESTESNFHDITRKDDNVDDKMEDTTTTPNDKTDNDTKTTQGMTIMNTTVIEAVPTMTIQNSDLQINDNIVGIATNLTLPSVNQNNKFNMNNITPNLTNVESPTIVLSNGTNSSNIESNTNPSLVYQNARYNNSFVDKIRLSSNPYSGEYVPSYSDRWDMYSEASKNSLSGFRPLAGLYYDGYLVKPITKRAGFIPIKTNFG